MSGPELFVYYRVREDHAQAAGPLVLAAQARLQGLYPVLVMRLLRRTDEGASHQTWMETYACEPDGVTPPMRDEIERQFREVLAWLDGPRHAETFAVWTATAGG
jgi:hypothetical protein